MRPTVSSPCREGILTIPHFTCSSWHVHPYLSKYLVNISLFTRPWVSWGQGPYLFMSLIYPQWLAWDLIFVEWMNDVMDLFGICWTQDLEIPSCGSTSKLWIRLSSWVTVILQGVIESPRITPSKKWSGRGRAGNSWEVELPWEWLLRTALLL